MRPHSLSILALSVTLALASTASAAIVTTFADAAAFQVTLESGSYLETFDSLTNPPSNPLNLSSGGFAFTVSGPNGLYSEIGGTGSRFLGLNNATDALTFTFTGGTPTAIGGNFFNTDMADNFTAGNVTLTLNDGTIYSFVSLNTGVSPFVGFTTDNANPITSLTIQSTSPSAWSSLDNLVVGRVAIPEPSTYALGAGVLALGFALWRRRR
jgi:hypothetical protein